MKLGFIGAGRMATALARGCVSAGLAKSCDVTASDPLEAARAKFAVDVPGAVVVDDNDAVLAAAETVVLAVKPQTMTAVLEGAGAGVAPRHLIVSIAAGVTLERLASLLPQGTRLVRVMPNTPCLIAQGVSCYSRGAHATDADLQAVAQLLGSVGAAYEVEESQLDAVTGLSGSGPAFVYSVIEAMAAGGATGGLEPELALRLAAETARGAAAMVLRTGLSPAALRDQVTSPGGTTLAGLEALGRTDAVAGLQQAVEAATRRSAELGRSA